MSLTWLPKAGSITEKNMADLWYGAMPLNRLPVRQNGYAPAVASPLRASGLTLYINPPASDVGAILFGYELSITASTDLSVTLPADRGVYVYLVLDMAGGGTNTIGQRLIYSSIPVTVSHGMLLAYIVTDADSVTDITYYCQTGNIETMVYPYDIGACTAYGPDLLSTTELTTNSTTAVLAKQFRVEYPGVYEFSTLIKRTTTGTGTVEIYVSSTGLSSAQLTFTTTSSTYAEKEGTLICSGGDSIYIYHKISTASGTMYTESTSVTGYYGVPVAPAFGKE